MLHIVGNYMKHGYMFLEKGLAHPSFLGRAVSWGIFYGTLALIVSKVSHYAYPKIKEYWDSRNKCVCERETPKGEIVLTDRKEPLEKPKVPIKDKPPIPPPNNIVSNECDEEETGEVQKKKEA
jgi:hypothetical protein